MRLASMHEQVYIDSPFSMGHRVAAHACHVLSLYTTSENTCPVDMDWIWCTRVPFQSLHACSYCMAMPTGVLSLTRLVGRAMQSTEPDRGLHCPPTSGHSWPVIYLLISYATHAAHAWCKAAAIQTQASTSRLYLTMLCSQPKLCRGPFVFPA